MKKDWLIKKEKLLLIYILLLAFGLRILGINFGLPNFFFHTDESLTFANVINFFDSELREERLVTIFHFFIFLLYRFFLVLREIFGKPASASQIKPEFFLFARMIGALISTGSIALTYLLARKIFKEKIALLASLFLALTFLDIQIAHYIKQDVYIQFLGLLILLIAFFSKKHRSLCWFLVGLLGSIKMNGLIFIVPLLFYFWTDGQKFTIKKASRFFFLIFLLFLGFILGHPLALREGKLFSYFAHYYEFWTERSFSLVGMDTSNGISNFSWWNQYLATTGLYYPFFFAFILGLIFLLKDFLRFTKKRRRMITGVVLTLLFYFIALLIRSVRCDRHIAPLTPFISILSAYFLVRFSENIQMRVSRKTFFLLQVGLLTLMFTPALVRGVLFSYQIGKKDTREKAAVWVMENFSKPQTIFAIDDTIHIGHYLQKEGFGNLMHLFPFDTKEIFLYPGEVLLIDSVDYHIAENYKNTEEYKGFWENYQLIKKEGELVKEFSQPLFKAGFFSPAFLEISSTVNAYHDPTVEVYKIPKLDEYAAEEISFEYRPEKMDHNMQLIEKNNHKFLFKESEKQGIIVGPHELFPKGNYLLEYLIINPDCYYDEAIIVLWVNSSGQPQPIAQTKFSCKSLSEYNKLNLQFRLEKPTRLELVLEAREGVSFFVEKAVLKRINYD